ncbi:STAS/SEC14 domain-containing protein [Yoonia sp. R2331]|uniref:STAS/SEC14 domain-containing protein n=1 Tax=Yoonia sp. R2331 TaxID=3237238 RepID=UPI0034E60418
MLRISKPAADRLDIDLSGSVSSIEMATGLDRLIAEAGDMTNGKVLYRITDFEMPSLSALMVEFGRLPSLFALLGKIDKCAVLCDATWLRNAAEFEGFVLPGIDIKSFGLDRESDAIAWLNGEKPDSGFDSVPI